MKKIFLAMGFSITILSGCGINNLQYEGQTRPIEQIENIIADQLEVENPDYDIELNILVENEND